MGCFHLAISVLDDRYRLLDLAAMQAILIGVSIRGDIHIGVPNNQAVGKSVNPHVIPPLATYI
jgi:hypothetical protein